MASQARRDRQLRSRVVGKENDADTVRAYYDHTAMVLKRRRTASIRLDNTGYDTSRARGSSAKLDDIDLALRLEKRVDGLRLHRDVQRRIGVPEKVDLKAVHAPFLHYTIVGDSWPEGTKEVVAALERLGVPVEVTVNKASDELKAAGESTRREVIAAAVRYRKKMDDGSQGQ